MKKKTNKKSALNLWNDVQGRVLPPVLLWALGVPGGVCVVLWFFFFRGK